jgi:hypothetical protein
MQFATPVTCFLLLHHIRLVIGRPSGPGFPVMSDVGWQVVPGFMCVLCKCSALRTIWLKHEAKHETWLTPRNESEVVEYCSMLVITERRCNMDCNSFFTFWQIMQSSYDRFGEASVLQQIHFRGFPYKTSDPGIHFWDGNYRVRRLRTILHGSLWVHQLLRY